MSVGENIRRYRKSRGMTQAQLAEAVGLTEGAVRHYESELWAEKRAQLETGEIDADEYEDWKASL